MLLSLYTIYDAEGQKPFFARDAYARPCSEQQQIKLKSAPPCDKLSVGEGDPMRSEERRKAILEELRKSPAELSASTLAAKFDVSRQIIVGDVALLRSAGETITATPRGYLLGRERGGLTRQIAVRHFSDALEAELNAFVDQGCTVLDVIVEHPLYGQLTGALQISNRYEVQQFLQRCEMAEAHPLSRLTDGIHLHTLSCPDEDAYERVNAALRALGILLEEG